MESSQRGEIALNGRQPGCLVYLSHLPASYCFLLCLCFSTWGLCYMKAKVRGGDWFWTKNVWCWVFPRRWAKPMAWSRRSWGQWSFYPVEQGTPEVASPTTSVQRKLIWAGGFHKTHVQTKSVWECTSSSLWSWQKPQACSTRQDKAVPEVSVSITSSTHDTMFDSGCCVCQSLQELTACSTWGRERGQAFIKWAQRCFQVGCPASGCILSHVCKQKNCCSF